jgi:precorrin-6A/cobalt-precorrin-6A reductase
VANPIINVLILGGTTEASALGRALAGDARFHGTISLAGRTRRPAPQPLPHRIGGFGGLAGLVGYLREQGIDALIDATHPFARQITAHAVAAAREVGLPLLVLQRLAWEPTAGDRWIMVPDMAAAAEALGRTPRRVLLTIGQKELAPFVAAGWHFYVLRSVEEPPPELLPCHVEVITARGPFAVADEQRLLRDRGIEIIVTKNSGGIATEGKLVAARALGLSVVMVSRPPPPAAATVASPAEAMAWLTRLYAGAARGV